MKSGHGVPLGSCSRLARAKPCPPPPGMALTRAPFLRTSNVLWDEIDLSSVDEMSIPEHELPAKLLRPGDLLVCEGGEIGRAATLGWRSRTDVVPESRASATSYCRRGRSPILRVLPTVWLHAEMGIYEGAGNKTTIPNLSRSRLAGLEGAAAAASSNSMTISCVLNRVRDAFKVQERERCHGPKPSNALPCTPCSRAACGARRRRRRRSGRLPESWGCGAALKRFAVEHRCRISAIQGRTGLWKRGSCSSSDYQKTGVPM